MNWIKVEDELPACSEGFSDHVLCLAFNYGDYYAIEGFYDSVEECWVDAYSCNNHEYLQVSHWMPLPSKPTS